MFSSPRLPPAPCSISLPPACELGWRKGSDPAGPRLWYITLFREVYLVHEVCVQSGAAFFLVAILWLVVLINYIFILFVVWGGVLCLTSHAAILNLSIESFLLYIDII